VEGELRALRERAQQDQDERDRVEGMCTHALAGGKDHVEVVAAHDVPEDDHAAQQRQPACAGDGQRHTRPALRVQPVMPVADEQERRQARELPEDHELNEISRDDDAEHRAHEREEERVESRDWVLG
jgi:hypothetical protein